MRKFISIFIIVTMFLTLNISAFAVGTAKISATSSEKEVKVGDEFTVSFRVDNADDLFSYELYGSYSKNKADLKSGAIAVKNINGTEAGSGYGINFVSKGKFNFSNSLKNGMPSDGVLVTATFKAVEAGDFTISFEEYSDNGNSGTLLLKKADSSNNSVEKCTIPNSCKTLTVTIAANGEIPSGGGGGGGGGGTITTPTDPVVPIIPTEPNAVFKDMGNHQWAVEAVEALAQRDILKGTSEGMFSPQSNIKRGDFLLILVRTLDLKAEFKDNFADVPKGSYYYDAVGICKELGIAKGTGKNYNPDGYMTRQDLITFAYRALLSTNKITDKENKADLNKFADVSQILEYAREPLAVMVDKNIITGSNNKLNPAQLATRAETAVMCYKILNSFILK